QCALSRVESAQRAIEPITTGVATNEGQVVRLVLVGDAPALVAFAVPNLDVHRAGESQHAEVRLDLIEVEHNPDVSVSDKLLQRTAAARKGEREAARFQHQIADVRTVNDQKDRTLQGQMFQRQPPLLELVEVLRP